MVTHHEDGSTLAARRCEGLRGSARHLGSRVRDRVRVDRCDREERRLAVAEARNVARSRENESISLVGGIDGFSLEVGIGLVAVFVVAEDGQSGQSERCDGFVPDATPDLNGRVAGAVDQVSSDTHEVTSFLRTEGVHRCYRRLQSFAWIADVAEREDVDAFGTWARLSGAQLPLSEVAFGACAPDVQGAVTCRWKDSLIRDGRGGGLLECGSARTCTPGLRCAGECSEDDETEGHTESDQGHGMEVGPTRH